MTDSGTPSAPSYRGLLALVIVLGVLIVLGVGALIGAAALGGGGRVRDAGPFNASIDAPGAHIESAELQGNRVLIRLSGGERGEELVILDAQSGRLLGRVVIKAK